MSRTGRLGNITMAKETTWGNYASATKYLRASTESLKNNIEHAEDPSLISEIYTSEMIKIAEGIGGTIEGVMHPDDIGLLVYGVLGDNSSVLANPIKSRLLVSYNSTENYVRLTKSGNNLTAEKSTNGSSWTADTNFSSLAGVIDVSSSLYDTLSELQTRIASRTGWDAIIFGDDTDSSDLSDFTAVTLRSNDVNLGGKVMSITKTSTTGKMHTITPAGASGSLPSFSFLMNRSLGAAASIAALGCKISTLSITNAAKDLCKFSITVNGKQESTGKADSVISAPSIESYLTANMKIVIEESDGVLTEMDEIKDFSLTINANLDENTVVGSYYKKEQDRQKSTIEISFTANNTQSQYDLRTNWTTDEPVTIYLYWKGNDYADTTALVPYSMFMRLQSVKLTDFSSPLSTPDRLTITATGTVIKPASTTNTYHIISEIVDNNTSSY